MLPWLARTARRGPAGFSPVARARLSAANRRREFSTLGSTAAPSRVMSWFEGLSNKGNVQPRLDEEVYVPYVADAASPATPMQMTTLKNGLRVASVDANSPMSAVAVFIDAGSRYEDGSNTGISHFMESVAFSGTPTKSEFGLVRHMMQTGNSLVCNTSRDCTAFFGECLRENASSLVGTLGDVINSTEYHEIELSAARERYLANLEELSINEQVQIMESVHEAAYFNNSVGRSMYAPKENVAYFTTQALKAHRDRFYVPSRMVLTGVGMEHAQLVELGEEHFPGSGAGAASIPAQNAAYTGGHIKRDTRDTAEGVFHVALAFEAPSWHHKDLVPACVLQMMMGGGSSFSAGGPGKGMYSRLFTNVLNKYGWVESATCFNSIYSDTSLFGIYGTSHHTNANQLVQVLFEEFSALTQSSVTDEELGRAKNALKSAIRLQLENRTARLEDIGRQLLTYDKVKQAADICKEVDAVTAADIQRVATALTSTKPSLAARGNTSHLTNL